MPSGSGPVASNVRVPNPVSLITKPLLMACVSQLSLSVKRRVIGALYADAVELCMVTYQSCALVRMLNCYPPFPSPQPLSPTFSLPTPSLYQHPSTHCNDIPLLNRRLSEMPNSGTETLRNFMVLIPVPKSIGILIPVHKSNKTQNNRNTLSFMSLSALLEARCGGLA